MRPVPDGVAPKPKSPKKPKPTTSYGDEHRSPTPITPGSTSAGGTTSVSVPTTYSPNVPHKVERRKSYGDSHRADRSPVGLIDTIVSGLRESVTPQAQTLQNIKDYASGKTGTAPAETAPKAPKYRPPAYIRKNPYVQSQIADAVALMGSDPEAATGALSDILEGRFYWDNSRLQARLDRKENNRREYYTEAEIQVEKGDLDYLTDNPIDPRWEHLPSLKGMNSPDAQFQLMQQAIAQNPENRADIEAYFKGKGSGDPRLKYTGWKGTIENAAFRQDLITKAQGNLESSKSYWDSTYAKAVASEEKYDNWGFTDEATQTAIEGAKVAASSPREKRRHQAILNAQPWYQKRYEVDVDENGNAVNPTLTRAGYRRELKRRIDSGNLQPDNLASLAASSDLLKQPDINWTPQQLKDLQAAHDIEAQAYDEEHNERAGWGSGFSIGGWHPMSTKSDYVDPVAQDLVLGAFDKISRPFRATNLMRLEWSKLDKEPSKDRKHHWNWADAMENADFTGLAKTWHAVTGKNFYDSIDDVGPTTQLKLMGAGWEGFSRGGLTGSDWSPDLWGEHVINYNAERDGVDNIYDNRHYQRWGGMAGEMIFDPLNAATVFTKPLTATAASIRAARAGQDVNKFRELSVEVSKLLDNTPEALTPTEVALMLDGNWGHQPVVNRAARDKLSRRQRRELEEANGLGYIEKIPTTAQQKVQYVEAARQGAAHLNERIDRAVAHRAASATGARTPEQVDALGKLAEGYKTRLNSVLEEHGNDVFREQLYKQLEADVRTGRITEEEASALDPVAHLHTEQLRELLPGIHEKLDFNDMVAGTLGVTANRGQAERLAHFETDAAKREALREEAYVEPGGSAQAPSVNPRTARKSELQALQGKLTEALQHAQDDPTTKAILKERADDLAKMKAEASQLPPNSREHNKVLSRIAKHEEATKALVQKAGPQNKKAAESIRAQIAKHEAETDRLEAELLAKRADPRYGSRTNVEALEELLPIADAPTYSNVDEAGFKITDEKIAAAEGKVSKGHYPTLEKRRIALKNSGDTEALAALDAKIEAAASKVEEAGHAKGVDLGETSLARDPRYSIGEVWSAVRQARRYAYRRITEGGKSRYADPEVNQLNKLKMDIKAKEKALKEQADTLSPGSRYYIEKEIESYGAAARRLQRNIDRRQAHDVITHLNALAERGVPEAANKGMRDWNALHEIKTIAESKLHELGEGDELYTGISNKHSEEIIPVKKKNKAFDAVDPLTGKSIEPMEEIETYAVAPGSNRTTSRSEVRNAEGSGRLVQEEAEHQGVLKDFLDKDSKYDARLIFEPRAPHSGKRHQLKSIIHETGIQMRELERQGFKQEADMIDLVKTAPEGLIREDGGLKWDEIMHVQATNSKPESGFLYFNREAQSWGTRSTGDAQFDQWMDGVAHHMDTVYQKHYKTASRNATRDIDAAIEKETASRVDDQYGLTQDEIEDIATMFAKRNPGEKVVLTDEIKNGEDLFPWVDHPETGKLMIMGAPEHEAALEFLATPDEIAMADRIVKELDDVGTARGIDKPPVAAQAEAFNSMVAEMQAQGWKTRHKSFGTGVGQQKPVRWFKKGEEDQFISMRDAVRKYSPQWSAKGIDERWQPIYKMAADAGWHFPDDPVARFKYVKTNRKAIMEDLGLAKNVFRRIFENKHGMSVADAQIWRERRTKRVVGKPDAGAAPRHPDDMTAWEQAYPEGITFREFMRDAVKNPQTFFRVFHVGPFKWNKLTQLSNKQAREAAEIAGEKWQGRGKSMAASRKWAQMNYEQLLKMNHQDARKELIEVFNKQAFRRSKAEEAERAAIKQQVTEELKPRRQRFERAHAVAEAAMVPARNEFDEAFRSGTLKQRIYNGELEIMPPVGRTHSTDELMRAVRVAKGDAVHAQLKELRQQRRASHDPSEVEQLTQKIAETTAEHKAALEGLKSAKAEASKATAVLKDRMADMAITRAAATDALDMRKQLVLGFAGVHIPIPNPRAMFKGVEEVSGPGLFVGSRNEWARANDPTRNPLFKPPSRQIPIDYHLARNRMVNHVPGVIELHAKYLTKLYGKIRPSQRMKVMELVRRGDLEAAKNMDPVTYEAITKSFEDLVPFFSGNYRLGDTESFINIPDINRRLPRGFKINESAVKKGINTPEDLIKAVYNPDMGAPTSKGAAVRAYKNTRAMRDPYAMSWNLRIGVETAIGEKSMHHVLNSQFGLKRGRIILKPDGSEIKAAGWSEAEKTLEELGKKGWEVIPELGGSHYFPPEAIGDIKNLLKMTGPRESGRFTELAENFIGLRIFDKATGLWKAAATMYNPGYYIRNGIGELMSAWLDGVWSFRPYKKAHNMMRWAKSQEGEIAELADHMPLLKYKSLFEKNVDPSAVAITMKNGRKITYRELWVAYNDRGLKTGFFNTEFENQAGARSRFAATPGINKVVGGHQKLRQAGETYEDTLRAGHFIDVVSKHKGTFEEAIDEAAQRVRKYHFDYTDFTQFEKSVMMRVFPFYKWTRKAIPLMATMMFTHPGKMLAIPKTMNTASNELTNTDFSEDPNGVAPNFTGIAPAWVQNLWGYQIAENTALRIATPQLDALSALRNPSAFGGQANTLLNPIIKGIGEQALGDTWGDEKYLGNSYNTDLQDPMDALGNPKTDETFGVNDERLKHLMKLLPQGSFLAKAFGTNRGGYDNTISKADAASFGTGLGFYDLFQKEGIGPSTNLPEEDYGPPTPSDERRYLKGAPVGSTALDRLLPVARPRAR